MSRLVKAEDEVLGRELARLGGSPQLIERLTCYGARWARNIVREECGIQTTHRRKDDASNWYDKNPERILHGYYVVKAYWATTPAHHPISRLIEAFITYRDMNYNPILDIDKSAAVIELAESGMAWERTCSSCQQRHLVVSEHAECPVCRRLGSILCKGCGTEMPEPGSNRHKGRPRKYCQVCETKPAQRISKTDRQRRLHNVAG